MIVVVGGHSRNIGKTSVVANLIHAVPEADWTAVKITQFGHGMCSKNGEPCGCETDIEHPFALAREADDRSGTDTARYLAAGASQAYWLRTRAGEIGFAIPALKTILERAENAVLESNSVLRFIKPDLFFIVVDPSIADFKSSCREFLDRADALLWAAALRRAWESVPLKLLSSAPAYELGPDFSLPRQLIEEVRSHHKVPLNHRR